MKDKRKEAEAIEKQLDEALEETFPASDPVSLVQPRKSAHDCAADEPTRAADEGEPRKRSRKPGEPDAESRAASKT